MRYLLFLSVFLLTFPAYADSIKEDKAAARIMVYYGVGHEDSPATSVTLSQFKAHLRELDKGHYNVVALPDLLAAYDKKAALPENSVVITFDGSENSVLTHAAPLLKKYQFPFTVFLAPERIRDRNPRYLSAKDIKRLQKIPLVSFGIHPENYDEKKLNDTETIRKNLNNAVSFYRDLFNTHPQYLAFPRGMYSQKQLSATEKYAFKALLGEHSGVVYQNKKNSVLPRFVMTENYANQQRFRMVSNALPIPADDHTPNISVISTTTPSIGLTTSDQLDLKKLSCYASDQEKPKIETLGNRVEIRLKTPIHTPRFRVNCTLPVIDEDSNLPQRWRWFGILLNASTP